jgi:hypothetical protein
MAANCAWRASNSEFPVPEEAKGSGAEAAAEGEFEGTVAPEKLSWGIIKAPAGAEFGLKPPTEPIWAGVGGGALGGLMALVSEGRGALFVA